MWPLLHAALPKCRVQKCFPHKVMFGTKRSQGIDIPSITVTQTVQPDPRDKNLDLMQAVWTSVQQSPVDWHPVHVHGHQDRKVKDSHHRLSALNSEMDARAKLFYRHLSSVLPTLEALQLPIHNEGWTVWSGDIKLPSPSRECLYAAIQDPITQLYWIRHKRFSFDARFAIDWDTCAAGMQALQPARRRWIAKGASSNCGVGTTLIKWQYQDNDRCPRCRVPEDCQTTNLGWSWSSSKRGVM